MINLSGQGRTAEVWYFVRHCRDLSEHLSVCVEALSRMAESVDRNYG